jgi:hypothetical protein
MKRVNEYLPLALNSDELWAETTARFLIEIDSVAEHHPADPECCP